MIKERLLKNGNFEDCIELDKMVEILESPEKSDFYETHHIIPKSVGGTDESDNLISISLKQHFLVHYYLTFCTKGILKRKMCFAFKQMIFTRDSFKSFDFDVIERLSEQYESLLKDGYFKNNYIRTEEIRDRISKKTSEVNKGKKWCNNMKEEKFVSIEEFNTLISAGYKAGRLPQPNITKALSGKKKRTSEEIQKEFEEAIKSQDNVKRWHVNLNGKNFRKTGKQIYKEKLPYRLGNIK